MGIDKNANGVRDDIESYIKANFTEPKKQKALMQYAKGFQEGLLVDPNDREQARAVSNKKGRLAKCVWDTFGRKADDPNNGYVLTDKIRAYTTNTKARLKAYLDYDKALSGMVFSLPRGDTCDE